VQVSAATEEVPVDVASLLARKAVEDQPVDDGSGKLTVWVVKDFKKVEVDRAQYGYVAAERLCNQALATSSLCQTLR
jgi:hypothetical protein